MRFFFDRGSGSLDAGRGVGRRFDLGARAEESAVATAAATTVTLLRGVNMSTAIRMTPATMATSATLNVGQWSLGLSESRPLSLRIQPARMSMKSTT